MEKCRQHIKDINEQFTYESDEALYGASEVWAGGLTEEGLGDCEDYAMEVQKVCGGDLYYCKYKGNGHAILKLPNGQWVDNIYRRPVNNLSLNYTNVVKYWKIMVWFKLFTGWIKQRLY